MKTHFLKLFDYDQYVNLLILENILAVDAPEKPVQLMAHLLATQQVWLNRCNRSSAAAGVIWPDWKVETFEPIIRDNHLDWIDFINQQKQGNFEETISYKNSKGEQYQKKLGDIIIHLLNHGTHHRAQIGQHLKLTGLTQLPATDYILFCNK